MAEMIYMVTERKNRTLKIGYTTDINRRRREYCTCSSCFEFIDVREGTKEDERKAQEMLKELGFTLIYEHENSEWFKMPKWLKKSEMKRLGFNLLDIKLKIVD